MNNPLPGSVEFWAQNKPDAIAIIEGERSLTWKQWNDRANCLAHAMHQRGIEAEDIVVVRTQIRLEWAIIRSALGKLGCRLLALNWRLTPSETRYILSNSNAKAIFCDDPDPDSLKPSWQHLHLKFAVSLDSEAAGFVSYQTMLEEESKQALFAAGDPPLIIFTSGTTGLPKGVVMNQPRPGSQTQMREYFISMAKSRPQVSGDIVLVTMPMHHGAGPALVSSGVRQGNTLIMMRRFDAEGALALIEKYRITFWNGVPTMFKRMACLPQVTLERFDVSSIRSLNVGAAPVTDDLKEWIINYFGNCLHEGYGTTETGMITALTPEMMLKKPGSSGLPYAHVKFSIRDDQQQQLPDGELGEIWVYTPMGISQYLTEALDHDTLDKDGFFALAISVMLTMKVIYISPIAAKI
ncbi:MAG: AMP-binding protein [Spongiibacteraceae bacterium]|nr:AMP-binding protein [Spongiibacteraceae bacterium]